MNLPPSRPSPSAYNRCPAVHVDPDKSVCHEGLTETLACLIPLIRLARTVALEQYPGALAESLIREMKLALPEALFLDCSEVFKTSQELRQQFAETVGSDPVFGFMHLWDIEAYFDAQKLETIRALIRKHPGTVILSGTGASRIVDHPDLLCYLSSTRWVLQQRQRAHQIGNLGLANPEETPALLYKKAFFVEWRTGDALRHEIFDRVDWFLDLDDPDLPKMLAGEVLRNAVTQVARRPFRLVPFFDPGPWGGQWMKQQFRLPEGVPNYAWAFDCVPEENSVFLEFGGRTFSLPAQVIVQESPEDLLGTVVYREFGAEFPIRFDYLDTVEGGNLSLQVHPLKDYIREHFGMSYTQDESYYILDCTPGSDLFLGLREGVNREAFGEALRQANAGAAPLDAAQWVNRIETHPHDHFSIPAGTVHCSGQGNVVLEISATPYIFTFKLWDWGRMGMDGRPRPVHLHHGLENVQWDRNTQWIKQNLLRPVVAVAEGDGWREERTGLHELEFLETRRHWFTSLVAHDTAGNLNVLCLVAGDEVIVESPEEAFPAMVIHYGETFIVPASVGRYTIRPAHETGGNYATMKAYVRVDEWEKYR